MATLIYGEDAGILAHVKPMVGIPAIRINLSEDDSSIKGFDPNGHGIIKVGMMQGALGKIYMGVVFAVAAAVFWGTLADSVDGALQAISDEVTPAA